MRTATITTILFAILTFLQGNSSPVFNPQNKVQGNQVFRDYVWYTDEDMTSPTGTISDVNTEIYRLQCLFGGYIFSSTYSMGLHEYEYGYYPYTFPVIIYSDL